MTDRNGNLNKNSRSGSREDGREPVRRNTAMNSREIMLEDEDYQDAICNMIRNCNIRLSVLLSCSCCRFRNIKTAICFADYDRNFFPCTNLIGIHGCPEQIPAGCIFRTSHIGPCSGSQQTAAAFLPDFLINSRQHI